MLAYVPAREFVRPSGDTGTPLVVPDIVVAGAAAAFEPCFTSAPQDTHTPFRSTSPCVFPSCFCWPRWVPRLRP